MEALTNKEQQYLDAARKCGRQGNLLKAESYYRLSRIEHERALDELYAARYAA